MNAAWTTFKVGGERPMRARGAQPLGANAECKNGSSPDWTRTSDKLINSQLLYRLNLYQ